MLSALFDSLKGFIGTMKKESVYDYTDLLFQNINDGVLPSFRSVLETPNLKVIKNNKYLSLFANQAELGTRDNYIALQKLEKTFIHISNSQKDIKKLLDAHFPKLMVNNVVRARDAAIVKFLQDLFSMTNYILDLLYFILIENNETDLPKIKLDRIKNGIGDFVTLYKAYSKPIDKILIEIAKMSDEEIPSELDQVLLEMKEKQLAKNGSLPNLPYSNFIGNPIYHIRMWLIDKDFQKVESLKIKKQLIELKLMELKLEQNGEKDPALSKQIKYYEDKLAGIEYEIEKLQK